MIVRKHEHGFSMIEQHYHAQLSRVAMEHWEDSHFWNDSRHESILYAIQHHDRGWRMFDMQPFWNDETNTPYAFTDFPTLAKTVLYRLGVDEIERKDAYAALLCSEHYTRFMRENETEEAARFVQQEQERQKRIISSLAIVDERRFFWHYELLRFADNMSLYICLNDPGVSKDDEHPFFQTGIPLVRSTENFTEGKMQVHWVNQDTICLSPFPFKASFAVTVQEKTIPKEEIATMGMLKSYEATNYKERKVIVQPE